MKEKLLLAKPQKSVLCYLKGRICLLKTACETNLKSALGRGTKPLRQKFPYSKSLPNRPKKVH
jgi:hypothetical protein